MSRLIWLTLTATFLVGVALSEIHPVDVEPVMKKEQPDFELEEEKEKKGSTNCSYIEYLEEMFIQHRQLQRQKLYDEAMQILDDTGNGVVAPSGTSGDSNTEKDGKAATDLSFTHAFVAALSMIIVTELGDKTFFIAAIMAMNHPRLTVFAGAMSALTIMHILSAFFGYIITWIPRVYTFYASSALFAIFGIKMLREGWKMKPDEGQEEFEEVQSDLRRRDDELKLDSLDGSEVGIERENMEEGGNNVSSRRSPTSSTKAKILLVVSRVFIQAFTMTFLAEWGDRSQIATVVMAAKEDVYGVVVGGLLGHFLCTGLAVVGGRIIAAKISIRTVTIIGGITFLIFAISAVIVGP